MSHVTSPFEKDGCAWYGGGITSFGYSRFASSSFIGSLGVEHVIAMNL
jgi:hypothetical protein